MKKFKFSLENVLKVRTIHKKIAERDHAVAQAKVNRTKQDIW